MATPTARRTPRGGGLPLIALGLVLALGTGFLVIYTMSGAAPISPTSQMAVVVVSKTINAGSLLTTDDSGVRIASAFVIEHMPTANAPADAYPYRSDADLLHLLDKHIVLSPLLAGDVLRTSDPRLIPLGNGPGNSWVNKDPNALPPGSVLFALRSTNNAGTSIGAQEGDHVDVLASICMPTTKAACEVTQTTLQNLLIYAVPNALTLLVVVTHQESLALKLLLEEGKIDLVLRKPGDSAPASTQAVDINWIIAHFGYTQP